MSWIGQHLTTLPDALDTNPSQEAELALIQNDFPTVGAESHKQVLYVILLFRFALGLT